MWRLRLIRFRLTLTYTLLLTGAFALFSAGIFLALHVVLYDNLQNKLNAAAQNVVQGVTVNLKQNSAPFNFSLKITSETYSGDVGPSVLRTGFFDANGRLMTGDHKGDSSLGSNPKVKQAMAKSMLSGTKQTVNVPTKNGDSTVMAVPLQDGAAEYVLLVQSSVQDVEDTLGLLVRILILSAVAMTMLSATGAWFLTGRLLRPIDMITDKARRITAHDLSQRLDIDTPDEFGRLAGTFDNMIARLQASFDRQKRFTSDASHELRTPLTVMQADISLALRRPRSNDEYRRTLESTQEEVSRLSHIVADLLTLARLDTDTAQIVHEPVALDELVEGVVGGLRPLASDKSILLTSVIEGPVVIDGDSTRLKQLVINLVDNAIAYTPEGGHVHVGLSSSDERVSLTVRDNGMGIEADQIPHIFERFYRGVEARHQHHQGTGLGLAIAQSAAIAHQGHIEVTSVVGQGSVFTFVLPRVGPPQVLEETGRLNWPLPAAVG
ncbi:MAG TPA: HAMP domain-containing sensor histidine kinase [Chloroflexota bacterium]|jgi:heavy metal sensor kinase